MSGATGNLSTLEVYERWAPSYPPAPHNPLMRAEQAAMLEHFPDVSGGCALDLACGSGRYAQLLAAAGAARVVAADFSQAMLARVAGAQRVRADLTSLPFAAQVFDVVLSGLAIGHATDLAVCLREIARVLRPGGVLRYSDFHSEASRVGLTRSFRDASNQAFTLPQAGFTLEEHRAALRAAGLEVESERELRVGHEIREAFEGSEDFYRSWHGVPLVFILQARR